jgi:tetratricopeptide (TPR) repeat protein
MPDPPIAPAVAAIRAGNFEQARKLCEEILAKNPNDFAANSTLCFLCIETDQRDAAERIIAQLLARNDLTAKQRCELGSRIFETGRIGEAVSWLGAQVADDPREPSIFWSRGLLQERWGDYTGAAESYAGAAERDPAYHGVGERLHQLREHIQRNATLRGNVDRIGRAIAEKLGDAVLTGPFKGMKFAPNIDISWAAELVGCYEQDLHPILEGLIATGRHQTIIDIGTSGGYYAVGMALRCPQAKVIGYEMDLARRTACEQVALNNHVRDRLELRGECARAELLSLEQVAQPTLIICDCEGAELDLLQAATIPLVRRSDVLVEVHDFILPRLERRLLVRFAATHAITRIAAIAPFPDSYQHLLPFLSPDDLELAVSDFRPVGMTWLALRPIQKAN